MTATKSRWINGIDSIRFFLALIVLLSHFRDPFVLLLKGSSVKPLQYMGVAINHLYFGVAAVIAFFVISGFVIHYPNRNKDHFDVVPFLLRRWLRIGLPLLLVGLVANHFNYYDRIPVWSLYCELIYYTIYPVLFSIKTSWKSKFIIAFVLSIAAAAFFGRDNFQSLLQQQQLNYNINYWQLGTSLTWLIGLPCWLLGVMLAEKIDKVDYTVSVATIWKYRVLVYLCSVFIFVLAAHLYVSCLFTLNFYALLLYVWIEKEIVYYRTHRVSRLFEYGGKFSYSIYLGHELCFIMLSAFIAYNGYTYLLFILLSLVISYVIYLLVEYPSHKLAQKVAALLAAKKQ